MEVFVLDRGLNLTGILQSFTQLEWHRKLYEPGTFSVSFIYTEEAAQILGVGCVLHNTDEKEPGIVTRLSKEITDRGIEMLVCKGYMASRYLSQRIVAKREILSGTPSEVMRSLVLANAIEPSDSDRVIPNLVMGEDASTVTESVEYQTEYTDLTKALTGLAKAWHMGYRLRLELAEKKLYFDIWNGEDRTVTGEHPCLISPEFGSALSQRYYEDASNYASYIICGSGTDDDRVTQDAGGGVGLDRYEMYATASGVSKKGLTEAEVKAQLRTAGLEKLAGYPMTKGFESKVNVTAGMEFDLGDVVTCENKRWGVREDMQVVAIKRTVRAGSDTVTATFGDEPQTLTGLLKAKE